jgi:hypothetical protein
MPEQCWHAADDDLDRRWGAEWNLSLAAGHAECSSTATARARISAMSRASPRNHNQEESADG